MQRRSIPGGVVLGVVVVLVKQWCLEVALWRLRLLLVWCFLTKEKKPCMHAEKINFGIIDRLE
jgi:hypothetical protein